MIAPAATLDTLEADLEKVASEINQLHRTITVNGAIEIGFHLNAVNETLANNKNGTFGKWVKEQLIISRSAAFNYMKAYRKFGESPYRPSLEQYDFTVEAVYELAGQDDETIESFIERAEDGERITRALVKDDSSQPAKKSDEPLALSDAMLRLGRVLRGVTKWFPAEYREALANRLLSAGDEILTTGGIR